MRLSDRSSPYLDIFTNSARLMRTRSFRCLRMRSYLIHCTFLHVVHVIFVLLYNTNKILSSYCTAWAINSLHFSNYYYLSYPHVVTHHCRDQTTGARSQDPGRGMTSYVIYPDFYLLTFFCSVRQNDHRPVEQGVSHSVEHDRLPHHVPQPREHRLDGIDLVVLCVHKHSL